MKKYVPRGFARVAAMVAVVAGVGTAAIAQSDDAAGPMRIEVDVSERMLHVYHNGDLMNSFEVAVGEPDHPTPTGEFSINRIIWNPAWVPPNAEWAEDKERKAPGDPDNPMQAAKIFFEYPDYYIHGTDAPHTLGQAESHGCLRMRPADVESLAKFVQDHGGEPRSDGWYERMQASDTNKTEVTLPDPVTILIYK